MYKLAQGKESTIIGRMGKTYTADNINDLPIDVLVRLERTKLVEKINNKIINEKEENDGRYTIETARPDADRINGSEGKKRNESKNTKPGKPDRV